MQATADRLAIVDAGAKLTLAKRVLTGSQDRYILAGLDSIESALDWLDRAMKRIIEKEREKTEA